MPASKKSSKSPQPSTSMIQPVPLPGPKIVPPPQKDAYSIILQDFLQQERHKAAEKRKAAMELKPSKENKRPRYGVKDDRLKRVFAKKTPKVPPPPKKEVSKEEKKRLDESMKRARLELEKRSYQPKPIGK